MTFKIGDKIRPIASKEKNTYEHWDRYWKERYGPSIDGCFYVVGVYGSWVDYSSIKNGSGPSVYSTELQLVTETPQPSFVKLIPEQVIPARREIVAGDIINVSDFTISVKPYSNSLVEIYTEDRVFGFPWAASELRELIMHLTTIADILEENAK